MRVVRGGQPFADDRRALAYSHRKPRSTGIPGVGQAQLSPDFWIAL